MAAAKKQVGEVTLRTVTDVHVAGKVALLQG
jgi:hypothetical protein